MRKRAHPAIEVLGLSLLIAVALAVLILFLPTDILLPLGLVALVGLLYFGVAVLLARYRERTPDWLDAAPVWLIIFGFVAFGVVLVHRFWEGMAPSTVLFLLALIFILFYFWLVVPFALVQKNEQLSWERSREVKEWPDVSLLVPAYKERGHITTTLDSIANLAYPAAIEVIVIDDGSLDGTYEEARDHPRTDPIVIQKENGGKHSALNAGLVEASHDIVVSIDADSWLAPDAVTSIVEGFARHPEAGAIAGNVKVGNRESFITRLQALEYIVGINTFRRAFDHGGLVSVVPGCLGAFRKEALEEVGGYSADTLTEDFDLTIELLRRGYPVHASEAIVYTYAPTFWTGLYRQRLRWYRGNLQTLLKHRDVFFEGGNDLVQKLVLPYSALSMSVLPLAGIAVVALIPVAISTGQWLMVVQMTTFFLLLFAMLSLLAVAIDAEDRRLALLSPFSLVGYKQFLDVTLLRSIVDVLLGREMGWTSGGRIEPPPKEEVVYDPKTRWPAFELSTDGEGWSWRLRSRNGQRTLASSVGAFASKEKAERTLDVFRKESRTQPELLIRSGADGLRGFHVTADDGGWRWQLLDEEGAVFAESERTHPTWWGARRALTSAQTGATSAVVRVVDSPEPRAEAETATSARNRRPFDGPAGSVRGASEDETVS